MDSHRTINPGVQDKLMRVMLVSFYDETCYGGRSLAAYLKEAGHQVRMVFFKRFRVREIPRDAPAIRRQLTEDGYLPCYESWPFYDVACPYPYEVTGEEYELFFREIQTFGPDILGFSTMSFHTPLTIRLSKMVRERHPGLMQVWGGIHATMNPEACLEYADAVCVGEGEEAFDEFLKDPRRTDVRNFCFKEKDGSIIKNPLRPLIADLDPLPFAMYGDAESEVVIEDNQAISPVTFGHKGSSLQINMTSQRGCPFKCTYCLHGRVKQLYSGQKYLRRRSVDRFLDEIELRVRQFDLEVIPLWDDVLMMDRKWIDEFADKYPQRIGLPFGGYGHPQMSTPHILKRMREAGAYYVLVGVQSGSDYLQKEIYGRTTTREKYLEFGRNIVDAGFKEIVYELMTRNPYESEDDLKATIDLLSKLPKAIRVTTKQLSLYPNTIISSLDKPRHNLPVEVFHFYNMLYLLAGMPGFDPTVLPHFAEDAYLRQHPEIVEKMVRGLATVDEARISDHEEIRQLKLRVSELENTMPWGVKRATQHLASQIGNRVKKHMQLAK
jgi:radical SAM superfamily enzyme YgiQ (UPF0313 family)